MDLTPDRFPLTGFTVMGIDEINKTIESWAYIEAGLRRARNREESGSAVWEKIDSQLKSVSDHLDRLEKRRDVLGRPSLVTPQKRVRFLSIEEVAA